MDEGDNNIPTVSSKRMGIKNRITSFQCLSLVYILLLSGVEIQKVQAFKRALIFLIFLIF